MKKLNKLLALAMAVVMTLGLSVTAMGTYADVEGRWMAADVAYVAEKGLMDGVSETAFEPDAKADRATVVVALYRLAGSPEVTAENPFTDVAEDASYRDAVVWAKENNVTNGTSDTTFAPEKEITRQDLVTLIHRYTKNSGKDVSVGEDTNILSYEDVETVKDYAIEAFQWACGAGVISGSDGKLLPRDNTTRAQLAKIIHFYAELDFDAAGETEEEPDLTDPAEILKAAYALKSGEKLDGTYTLTGVVADIKYAYSASSNDISIYMVVDGDTDRPLYCFRMKGEGIKDLIVGDTVTVTGPIKNYEGEIEFDQPELVAVEKTGKPLEAMTDAEAILKAAYELAAGDKMSAPATLTGVITSIKSPYSEKYKNIEVVIQVGDHADMPIVCYRLSGEGTESLAIGDTITVTGTIINFYGTVEFDQGCNLDEVIKG